ADVGRSRACAAGGRGRSGGGGGCSGGSSARGVMSAEWLMGDYPQYANACWTVRGACEVYAENPAFVSANTRFFCGICEPGRGNHDGFGAPGTTGCHTRV